jgi:hypothetical protein
VRKSIPAPLEVIERQRIVEKLVGVQPRRAKAVELRGKCR